jgi:chromosome segregation ATPase
VGLLAKIKKLEAQNEEIKLAGIFSEARIAAIEEKLSVKNEELLANKMKSEELRIKAEEKIMYLQLQLNNVKGREELAGHDSIAMKREVEKMKEVAVEREMVLSQRKELIEKLQNKLFENENDFTSLRQKLADGEKNLTALKMLKDESQGLLAALRKDLRTVFDSKENAIARVQELEEYKLKTENVNIKILGELMVLMHIDDPMG